MADKKLNLGTGLIDGSGGLHGACRTPHVTPVTVGYADAAGRRRPGLPHQHGLDRRSCGGAA